MAYSITDAYKMKREILNFSKNFSTRLSSPDVKFTADMAYGIVASKSCPKRLPMLWIVDMMMWDLKQDFVIRLTQKRKLFFYGK